MDYQALFTACTPELRYCLTGTNTPAPEIYILQAVGAVTTPFRLPIGRQEPFVEVGSVHQQHFLDDHA